MSLFDRKTAGRQANGALFGVCPIKEIFFDKKGLLSLTFDHDPEYNGFNK
jgi:hypothetical protein